MTISIKRRDLITNISFGYQKDSVSNQTFNNTFRRVQETSSRGHPYRLLGKTNIDIGGGFSTKTAYCFSTGGVSVEVGRYNKTSGSPIRTYKGEVYARRNTFTPNALDYPTPSSESQMDSMGSTGIARALPTNPLSGMGQFLGELRDLPRLFGVSLWKARAKGFRELARAGSNEYLNVQFGWLPFVKDITDFLEVTKDKEKIMAKYSSESGKKIHRKSTIIDKIDSVQSGYATNVTCSPALHGTIAPLGSITQITTTRQKVWFSGAFTYYLPPADGTPVNMRKRRRAMLRKLYGLAVTPDLVWNLAPWSWAVDWIGNHGDVIRNWSAFQSDGLVMHYGYVMETKTRTETYTWQGTWPKTDSLYQYKEGPSALNQIFLYESKTRRKATPYGFGLDPGGFSARQWSIIAALGISRRPRSLDN